MTSKNEESKFGGHADKFNNTMRICTSVGGDGGKTMTWFVGGKTKETCNEYVTIMTPHGTLIAMTQEIAGVVYCKEKQCYIHHGVDGIADTLLIGVHYNYLNYDLPSKVFEADWKDGDSGIVLTKEETTKILQSCAENFYTEQSIGMGEGEEGVKLLSKIGHKITMGTKKGDTTSDNTELEDTDNIMYKKNVWRVVSGSKPLLKFLCEKGLLIDYYRWDNEQLYMALQVAMQRDKLFVDAHKAKLGKMSWWSGGGPIFSGRVYNLLGQFGIFREYYKWLGEEFLPSGEFVAGFVVYYDWKADEDEEDDLLD